MPKKQEESLSFEEAMEQLQDIVDAMETGQLPLEQIIEQYEKGMKHVDFCSNKLKEAEKKIVLLTKTRSGEIKTSPLDVNQPADTEEVEAPRRKHKSEEDDTSLF